MAEITREQALDVIQNDWATYVEDFQSFSPAAQAEFLSRQGYGSLSALLAHIIAWWQDGQRVIVSLRDNPDFAPPDYDMDAFNAQAVARFQSRGEPSILDTFEQARAGWISFIEDLPASAFQNQHIAHRLYMELVFHLQEHALSPEK
jgi:hypothetical protein